MKLIPLNRATKSRIKKAYKMLEITGPISHQKMQNYLGMDWNLHLMSAYVNFYGITFDPKIKKWRQSEIHKRILKKKEDYCNEQRSKPFAAEHYGYINTL